jgi:ABC-type transport system involved in cytochrome bd biosynthesis fused ATPase/permease subunit
VTAPKAELPYRYYLGGTTWWSRVTAIATLHAATLLALPLTVLALGSELGAVPILAGFAFEVARSVVRRDLRRRVRSSFLKKASLEALDKRSLAPEADVDSAFWTASLLEYAITVDLPAVLASAFAGLCIAWLALPAFGGSALSLLLALSVLLLGLAAWSSSRRAPALEAVLKARQRTAAWIAAAERDCGEIYGEAARVPFLANLMSSIEVWSSAEDRLERRQLGHRLLLGALFLGGLLAILLAQGIDPFGPELSRVFSTHEASASQLLLLSTGLPAAYVFATHADSLLAAHLYLRKVWSPPPPATSTFTLPGRPSRLSSSKLSFYYSPSSPVLTQLDLDLDLSRMAVIVGPNGTGKTTLALLICGGLVPRSGSISVDGIACAKVARDDLGFVPQNPLIVDALSIGDNVRLVAPHASADTISDLLLDLGLERGLDEPAGKLSRGEQRRLAIARAVLKDPRLLVLDEPDAWLDRDGRATLARVLERELTTRAIVIISHHQEWLPKNATVLELSSDQQSPARASGDPAFGSNSACG